MKRQSHMTSESNAPQHKLPEGSATLIESVKIQLLKLRDLRQKDNRLCESQNMPFIDIVCDRFNGDNLFSNVTEVALNFIKSELCSARVLSLFGESGSGKTTSLLQVESTLWQVFDFEKIGEMPQFFPIFMDLSFMNLSAFHNMSLLEAALLYNSNVLKLSDLAQLKSHLNLTPVWLLDSFDEMSASRSFSEELYECGISIVARRRQIRDTLDGGNIEDFLAPKQPEGEARGHFEQAGLLPFSDGQIKDYFDRYIRLSEQKGGEQVYTLKEYLSVIELMPKLKNFATNPYLMSQLCANLPSLLSLYPQIQEAMEEVSLHVIESTNNQNETKNETNQDASAIPITNFEAPSYFYNRNKLLEYRLSGILNCCEVIKVLVDVRLSETLSKFTGESDWPLDKTDDYRGYCYQFCEEVAFRMFQQGGRDFIIDLGDEKDAVLLCGGIPSKYILKSSPLVKVGEPSLYKFPHKSLWEYFLASRSMRLPFDTLSERFFTQNRDLLFAFAHVLDQQDNMVEEYVKIVLKSRTESTDIKEDNKLVTAASNAMSVLNFAFNNGLTSFSFTKVQDWSGIRVPNVNLNQANIIGCNFDGADLSNASFTETSLIAASFKNADLRGVSSCFDLVMSGDSSSTIKSISARYDGKYVATGSYYGSVRIWDLETGKCAFISPHAQKVWGSPAVSIVALTSTESHGISLWDSTKRKFCGSLIGHTRSINCFCFSQDGKIGISCSYDGTIKIWDISKLVCVQTLSVGEDVNYISVSSDGTKLVSSSNGKLQFWDLEECKMINTANSTKMLQVDFHPTREIIAAAGVRSSIVEIMETKTTHTIDSIEVKGEISQISFLPDGSLVILADHLEIWDIDENRCLRSLQDKFASNSLFAVSNDLKSIATVSCGAADSLYKVWDLKTLELLSSFERGSSIPSGIAFSHDSSCLITIIDGASYFIIKNITAGDSTRVSLGQNDTLDSVVFRPGSNMLASSSENGFRLWDTSNSPTDWYCYFRLSDDIGLSKIDFSPDGGLIVGSHDGKCVLFDYEKKSIIRTISGTNTPLTAVFSPDGSVFACITDLDYGRDFTISIFDTKTRKRLLKWEADTNCRNIRFSPNGSILAYSTNTSLSVLNWKSGKSRLLCYGFISDICFHPKNDRVLAASRYGAIKVWDTFTGELLTVAASQFSRFSHICFTHDGTRLISSCGEKLLVFDNKPFSVIPNFSKSYCDFEFAKINPDGKTVVILRSDGLYLHSIDTFTEVVKIAGFKNNRNVEISKDSSLLAYSESCYGNDSEVIQVYDLKTFNLVLQLKGSQAHFNASGDRLLYKGRKGCMKIHNFETGRRCLKVRGRFRRHVNLSPDGKKMFSSYYETGCVIILDAQTGRSLYRLESDIPVEVDTVVSPGGKFLAVCGQTYDYRSDLELWNLETTERVFYLKKADCVCFNADDTMLAFARKSNIVLLDLKTMKHIATKAGHKGTISQISIDAFNRFMVSSCDSSIIAWDLKTLLPHSTFGFPISQLDACALQDAKLDDSFTSQLSIVTVGLNREEINIFNEDELNFDSDAFEELPDDFDDEDEELHHPDLSESSADDADIVGNLRVEREDEEENSEEENIHDNADNENDNEEDFDEEDFDEEDYDEDAQEDEDGYADSEDNEEDEGDEDDEKNEDNQDIESDEGENSQGTFRI